MRVYFMWANPTWRAYGWDFVAYIVCYELLFKVKFKTGTVKETAA